MFRGDQLLSSGEGVDMVLGLVVLGLEFGVVRFGRGISRFEAGEELYGVMDPGQGCFEVGRCRGVGSGFDVSGQVRHEVVTGWSMGRAKIVLRRGGGVGA